MVVSMGISDSPIIQRIAQLRVTQKVRGLDKVQQKEMDLCLDWLVNHCWQQALLKNYSLLASMTNDTDWQHEICLEIDELPYNTKKPGRKDATD
jgi:hypothetical protein